MMNYEIPVVDLFAGPGGLGEGFSSFVKKKSSYRFSIRLSIEKDINAFRTLKLRTFFREFPINNRPEEYYMYLRGEISKKQLFERYPVEINSAQTKVWLATLGDISPENVDARIRDQVSGRKNWVLIGGPPCQAYSTVGRSRLGGINPADRRVYLYREYLRIIASHSPPVFVMENVKGILSSKVGDNLIFKQILEDLQNPPAAVRALKGKNKNKLRDVGYRIFSLVKKPVDLDLKGMPIYDHRDFIIKCEDYGIPQARHRVILLGIRDDLIKITPNVLHPVEHIPAKKVLFGLPKLRSGLSREADTPGNWLDRIFETLHRRWLRGAKRKAGEEVYEELCSTIINLKPPRYDRGGEFIPFNPKVGYCHKWYLDPNLKGVCNSFTKSHMVEDLHRYLYVSAFAKIKGFSPTLSNFPPDLYPKHTNIKESLDHDNFSDRFRVQIGSRPATTITSHIAKDGHYYIHPDPSQCRSLTVREAARLQTFPDNYFFCGSRTAQYNQVGNAVPPLLAKQVADIVFNVLEKIN